MVHERSDLICPKENRIKRIKEEEAADGDDGEEEEEGATGKR